MDANLHSEPWALYRRFFIEELLGEREARDHRGVQVATSLQPALWDHPEYGRWLVWERVANSIPLWGPSYRRSVGNRVTDALLQFLFNVDPPHADDLGALRAANETRARLAREMASAASTRVRSESAWRSAFSSGRSLEPQDARAETLAKELQEQAASIQSLTGTLHEQAQRAGGDGLLLAEALQAFNNPAFQSEVVADSGVRTSCHQWVVRPDLSRFVADAGAGRARRIDVEFSSDGSSLSRAGHGLQQSTDTGFVRLGLVTRPRALASAALEPRTLEAQETLAPGEPYRIRIRAEGVAGIGLEPTAWFDERAIRRFRDGPFLSDGPFGNGTATLWGEKGVFPFRPARVHVVYRPCVELRVGRATFEAKRAAWAARRALGVGPFEFSSDEAHLHSRDDAEFVESTLTVRLVSRSPHPMIAAMESVVMPEGSNPEDPAAAGA